MPYPVIESMTTIRDIGYNIRVWRMELEVKDVYDNGDLTRAIRDKFFRDFMAPRSHAELPPTLSTIAEFVTTLPRVNAVEVTTYDGNGIILYTQWP